MSITSLRQVSPTEIYQEAKRFLRNIEHRLDAQPPHQAEPGEELIQAERLIGAFQEVGKDSAEFARRSQKLEEKLNLIRQRITQLTATPLPSPQEEMEELIIPSRLFSQKEKKQLGLARVMITQLKASLRRIDNILEKKLQPGELSSLVSQLPEKSAIYELHKKRLRASTDEALAKKAKQPDFGKRSFKNKDKKYEVPREERLNTLQECKKNLEENLNSSTIKIEKIKQAIKQTAPIIEMMKEIGRQWKTLINEPTLPEENRERQKALIHRFAEGIASLKGLSFERLTPENSASWKKFAADKHAAREDQVSWKQLAGFYVGDYPETKESFNALLCMIDQNGLDPFPFECLPLELQWVITSHLPTHFELISLANTCTGLYQRLVNSKDNSIWKPVLVKEGMILSNQQPLTFFSNSFRLQVEFFSRTFYWLADGSMIPSNHPWKHYVEDCEKILQEEKEPITRRIELEDKLKELCKHPLRPPSRFFKEALLIPNHYVRGIALIAMLRDTRLTADLKAMVIEKLLEILPSNPELANRLMEILSRNEKGWDTDFRIGVFEKILEILPSNPPLCQHLVDWHSMVFIDDSNRNFLDQVFKKLAETLSSHPDLYESLIAFLADDWYRDLDFTLQSLEKISNSLPSNPSLGEPLTGALKKITKDLTEWYQFPLPQFKEQFLEILRRIALTLPDITTTVIAPIEQLTPPPEDCLD